MSGSSLTCAMSQTETCVGSTRPPAPPQVMTGVPVITHAFMIAALSSVCMEESVRCEDPVRLMQT